MKSDSNKQLHSSEIVLQFQLMSRFLNEWAQLADYIDSLIKPIHYYNFCTND